MEHYSARKRGKLARPQMNLTCVVLSEKAQKAAYCLMPLKNIVEEVILHGKGTDPWSGVGGGGEWTTDGY